MSQAERTGTGMRNALLAFLIVLCLFTVLVHHYWSVCDDAFISFRYARNLASGLGLRYNIGDHAPVEGYSNFLWVLLCAAFERLGMEVTLWAPLVSALSGAALLWSLWQVLRYRLRLVSPVAFVTVLILGVFPPLALWSAGGMETVPFALAVFLAFYFLVLHERPSRGVAVGSVASILAIILLRVDGFVWAVLVGLCAVAVRRRGAKRLWREYRAQLLTIVVGAAIYLVWRQAYYGHLIANTVLAKGMLTPSTLIRGARYVAVFFLTFPASLAAIPGTMLAVRRWGRLGAAVSLVFWGAVAFAVLVGGDFMAMGRLLVVGLPFMAIIIGCLLQYVHERTLGSRRWAAWALAGGIIALGILPVWNLHVVPTTVRSALHFRYNSPAFRSETEQWEAMKENSERWKTAGVTLARRARPGESIVSPTIGNIGYYSNLYIYDMCGLVSPEVAALPQRPGRFSPGHDKLVSPAFFFDRNPSYVFEGLVDGSGLEEAVRAYVPIWKKFLRDAPYVPTVVVLRDERSTVEERALLLLRHTRPGESKADAWNDFQSDVEDVTGPFRIPLR